MSVGILGSGFGLYGYLPAIVVGCQQPAVLPATYREKFQSRAELRALAPHIHWAATEEELLGQVDTLILARRPIDQARHAADYAARPGIKRLLLEKPLAPDPDKAAQLLARLEQSGKIFRIGYNFGLTDWALALADLLQGRRLGESWSITWQFKAHHYAAGLRNWKRSVSQGGGALRFFGIHVVALLAELGYSDVAYSRVEATAADEAETWSARVTGRGLPPCEVRVESNAQTPHFSIVANPGASDRRAIVYQSDPFEHLPRMDELDRRVALLTRLCQDLLFEKAVSCRWYARALQLWSRLEQSADR